ncbi:MAG: aminotransferase class III-fold pyridoxal phosphate-dependent enzyme, partial [Crocinitomicaceae bacterium]|nr:aminotransferase class III-fold pyridoxal phosphate-dependent enzyme [Crocinitomicaceae bacterium]
MELFNVYSKYNIALTRAKGSHVYDDKNQEYLDLYGGHGVISVGHGHPDYKEALQLQLDKIGFYSNAIEIPEQIEVAKSLQEITGYNNHELFLCNSGTEANENALKLASFHTGKNTIIAFKNSFHGRTSASLNVTDNPNISSTLNQENFPVIFCELNNSAQLKEAFAENDVAGVIIEGIQGVGG